MFVFSIPRSRLPIHDLTTYDNDSRANGIRLSFAKPFNQPNFTRPTFNKVKKLKVSTKWSPSNSLCRYFSPCSLRRSVSPSMSVLLSTLASRPTPTASHTVSVLFPRLVDLQVRPPYTPNLPLSNCSQLVPRNARPSLTPLPSQRMSIGWLSATLMIA